MWPFKKKPKIEHTIDDFYGLIEKPKIREVDGVYQLEIPLDKDTCRPLNIKGIYISEEVLTNDEITKPVEYEKNGKIGYLIPSKGKGGFPLYVYRVGLTEMRSDSPTGKIMSELEIKHPLRILDLQKHYNCWVLGDCYFLSGMLFLVPEDGRRIYVHNKKKNREFWIWYDNEEKRIKAEDYNVLKEVEKHLLQVDKDEEIVEKFKKVK